LCSKKIYIDFISAKSYNVDDKENTMKTTKEGEF